MHGRGHVLGRIHGARFHLALGTALMVLGPQAGLKLLDSLPGCEGWLV